MARNTSVYEVTVGDSTEQCATLREVKAVLGDNTITTKAIMNGEVEGVVMVDTGSIEDTIKDAIVAKSGIPADNLEVVYVTEKVEPTPEAIKAIEQAHLDHKALTNTEDESTALTNTEDSEEEVDEPSDSQLEYPEVGTFETEKAMKKYVKGLTDDNLAEWCELEGATYKTCDHQSINRMRMAMALKALHFPDTAPKAGSAKKKSKYADYTTEQLVQMALDNNVEVRDDKGDLRILRMYTIMALKEAKLLG